MNLQQAAIQYSWLSFSVWKWREDRVFPSCLFKGKWKGQKRIMIFLMVWKQWRCTLTTTYVWIWEIFWVQLMSSTTTTLCKWSFAKFTLQVKSKSACVLQVLEHFLKFTSNISGRVSFCEAWSGHSNGGVSVYLLANQCHRKSWHLFAEQWTVGESKTSGEGPSSCSSNHSNACTDEAATERELRGNNYV